MTKSLENRVYKRVQFFMVPATEHEVRPVWVFNSKNPGKSLAGLVVNMSESGIQVLTDAEEVPQNMRYRLSFLVDEQAGIVDVPDTIVQWVWSESGNGLFTRSGFSFIDELTADVKRLFDLVSSGKQVYLRCAIEAIDIDEQQRLSA